ncbi:MAG: c-type cytochrome [Acidobacteriota bacterium]
MMRSNKTLLFVLALAAGLLYMASSSVANGLLSGTEKTVVLSDIEFSPDRLQVSVGDTIHFINKDKFEHDVYLVRTANPNDVLHEPTTIPPGQSITVKIDQEGLFTLYCTIHGGMSGKISTTGSFELTEEEKARAAARKVVPAVAKAGEVLFWGRAQCHQCHKIGDQGDGIRGPDLLDIGFRASARAKKFGLGNATEYITQSVMEPSAHLVEGYTDDMATVYQPPIDLKEKDLEAVIAYLQSQGGEVDTWLIDINPKVLAQKQPPNPYRQGDPTRGKQVFEKMRCYSCHKVGDRKTISVGPDLTEIGAFRNWQWLSESSFKPNAEIGSNWIRATVHLKNGETYTGALRKNTEKEVQVLIGPDQLKTFPGSQVERVQIYDTTRMPANYEKLMTEQERADLIRYLQSLKGDEVSASR